MIPPLMLSPKIISLFPISLTTPILSSSIRAILIDMIFWLQGIFDCAMTMTNNFTLKFYEAITFSSHLIISFIHKCSLCALNTKRRALDQIERQLKSGSANLQIAPGLMDEKMDLCDARSFTFETKNMDTKDSKDADYGSEVCIYQLANIYLSVRRLSFHQPVHLSVR
uniref:Uncharacterized protein n=1 Tax=Elaeophora elaphi TaxID=1147741 RepID=A0A158Q774_9BILA